MAAMGMEGPLMKWTNVMKGWQYRWFVLDESAGLLSYYTSKEKMARGARRGCVRLKGAIVSIDDDECTFTITVDGKVFHFQAQNAVEREKWIRALDDTRQRHARLLQKRWDPKTPVPTVEDFNKKLTETDAFLQIMIDQVKAIEVKVERCTNPQGLERLTRVRDKANGMLESIKHSIVLLQIAKNVAHPVNGIYQPNLRERTAKLTPKSSRASAKKRVDEKSSPLLAPAKPPPPPPSDFGGSDDEGFETLFNPAAFLLDAPLDAPIISGIEAGVECFEEANKALIVKGEEQRVNKVTASLATNIPGFVKPEDDKLSVSNSPVQTDVLSSVPPSTVSSLFVPETSYSSSEDEDFFDASEFANMPGSRSVDDVAERGIASRDEDHLVTALRTSRLSIDSDGDQLMDTTRKAIDYDEIYEDDEEEELGSVESQGSVISHLLSQVKLGMDLTKVVLPTFILERRSLLEMYADFFAHPDLFVSIADHADPKDRMIQAVRWYLSAFHAGRKSSVAKKPYNPLLGEMFKCIWDVPGTNGSTEPVSDGPIPWAAKGQLTFVAEQVSHHPPISAFYAEHYDKRITLGAHIWTKSKFLGLSIGVHMIGQGCISLVDYDEEYILTFPNGYGRSILTIPWVELGGSTSINCLKTGYSANIEFVTKPFYGGKKHRITAEVFQPNDKKPFLSMSGEWNGVIHAKWADGKTEVFVDTTKIPIMKKKVEPVRVQEEYESRRLWKGVTAGLRYRHIEQATESKFKLEQRQREEARERKEKGTNWETRFFHEVGGNWVYDKPLQKRLSANTATSNSQVS